MCPLDAPDRRETNSHRAQRAQLQGTDGYPPAPLEPLPLHNLAETKYRQLDRPFTPLSAPSSSDREALRSQIQSLIAVPVRLLSAGLNSL